VDRTSDRTLQPTSRAIKEAASSKRCFSKQTTFWCPSQKSIVNVAVGKNGSMLVCSPVFSVEVENVFLVVNINDVHANIPGDRADCESVRGTRVQPVIGRKTGSVLVTKNDVRVPRLPKIRTTEKSLHVEAVHNSRLIGRREIPIPESNEASQSNAGRDMSTDSRFQVVPPVVSGIVREAIGCHRPSG